MLIFILDWWLIRNRQRSEKKEKAAMTVGEAVNSIISLDKCKIKLRCDERFTHAFTACGCVFNEITMVGSNQGNYFENATASSKRTLKTTVATQLYFLKDADFVTD